MKAVILNAQHGDPHASRGRDGAHLRPVTLRDPHEDLRLAQPDVVRVAGRMWQERARVVAAGEGGALSVRTRLGESEARVALSCLVRPEVGDAVLVALAEEGDAFVLAVLERPSEGPIELTSERDIALRSVGSLAISAPDGVHVDGGAKLVARADELHAQGAKAKAVFPEIEVLAGKLSSRIAEVRSAGQKLELVFGTLTERLMNAYRRVEGSDVSHAGDVDARADGVHSVRARHASVIAEELVRLDGEQIHMG